MDKDVLSQQLLALFVEELGEHLTALNRDLLALEEAKDSEAARQQRLTTLFRTVHVIKGSSRSASVRAIESACHQLESVLVKARETGRALTAEQFALFFAFADAFTEMRRRLLAKEANAAEPVERLLPQLDAETRRQALPTVAAASVAVIEPAAPEAARAVTAVSVRVTAEKLDLLLARASEVFVAQRRLESREDELSGLQDAIDEQLATLGRDGKKSVDAQATADGLTRIKRAVDRLAEALRGDWRALDRATRPLDDEIHSARMVPFIEACQGLDRVVRDLAVAEGKQVRLVIEGGEVELDRALIENLRTPLLHLVRNAIDHGIEPKAARDAAGKVPVGLVMVRAEVAGAVVRITVSDDGRGIDRDQIASEARRRGLAEVGDAHDLTRLLFKPGFSTARIVTDISGRGVGLDVVRSEIEALHGSVSLSSPPDGGTSFVLNLPLTVSTLKALTISDGGQSFVIPSNNVERLVRLGADEVRTIEGREVMMLDGWPVPVMRLATLLGLDRPTERAEGRAPVMVVSVDNQRVALAVDELAREQDVVLKRLPAQLRRVKFFSGATLLPTGDVALILSGPDLIAAALQQAPSRPLVDQLRKKPAAQRKRVLLVDDSVTTRTLEKSILEGAGYEVRVAVDGAEAWRLLQDFGADVVVSDVEMPRMDGFALTDAIRRAPRFRDLPVLLVTALEQPGDRARGLEVGASAYLIKSAFDQQNLLATLSHLLD